VPITIVCPKCSTKLNAPDVAAGKRVKCPKAGCGTVIAVPASAPQPPPFEVVEESPKSQPAAKKTARVAIENDVPPRKKIQKSRDEDDADELPKSKPKKSRMDDDGTEEEERPKSKRRRDDDTEEEEAPRSKRRRQEDTEEEEIPRSKRRRQEGDEEEEEDRPKKKKKKKSGGIPPVAIVGIIVGVLVVMGGVGYAIYALAFSDDKDGKTTSNSNSNPGSSSNTNSGFGGSAYHRKELPLPGWVDFKYDQDGFIAFFPGKPDEKMESELKIYSFVDLSVKHGYIVMVYTPGTPILPEKQKEFVDLRVKSMLTDAGMKETSHKDTTLAGLPATEYLTDTFEKPPGKGTLPGKGFDKIGEHNPVGGVFRVLYTDKRLYIVGLVSGIGMPTADRMFGFFDNFELLK
jgi:hypothetical protein